MKVIGFALLFVIMGIAMGAPIGSSEDDEEVTKVAEISIPMEIEEETTASGEESEEETSGEEQTTREGSGEETTHEDSGDMTTQEGSGEETTHEAATQETTAGDTETTAGATETTAGATETTAGATETTAGAMETTAGATETTAGATTLTGETTLTAETSVTGETTLPPVDSTVSTLTDSLLTEFDAFFYANKAIFDRVSSPKPSEDTLTAYECYLDRFYKSMDPFSLMEMTNLLGNKPWDWFGSNEEEEKALISEVIAKLWEMEQMAEGEADEEQIGFFFKFYSEVLEGLGAKDLKRVVELYDEVLRKATTTEAVEPTSLVSEELTRFIEANKLIFANSLPIDEGSKEAYIWYLQFFYKRLDSSSLTEMAEILENKAADEFGDDFVKETKFLKRFLDLHRELVAKTKCEGLDQLETFLGIYGRVLEGLSVEKFEEAIRVFFPLVKNAKKLSPDEC